MPHYRCTNCGAAVYRSASGRHPCPECEEWGYLTGSFTECGEEDPVTGASCRRPEDHDPPHMVKVRREWGGEDA